VRDVRLLIAFAACRQTLFPIPVITLFWRHELGMSLADVMLLQAIFALAATVCEVPSGYVADRIGHRGSLLFAAWLWLGGWILYGLAGTFAAAVVAEVALGTAIAFASGADSALLWVALERAGRTAEYTRWEGRLQAAAQTAESLSAVAGGYLYSLAPRLPMWLQVPSAGLALGAVLAMRPSPPAAVTDGRHVERLVRLTRLTLHGHIRLRTTIGLSMALGLSSFVLVWLIQPYMEERGVPPLWFGPIWAGANLWLAGAALASHAVAAALGLGPTLFGCCLLVAAGYGLLAATPAAYGVVFYLLIMTVRGIQIPLLRERLQADAPPEDRATVLSLNAMAFRMVFVVGGPLVGVLLTRLPLNTVLAILGALLATFSLLALAAFRRAHPSARRAPRAGPTGRS
jgi:MFS family permease